MPNPVNRAFLLKPWLLSMCKFYLILSKVCDGSRDSPNEQRFSEEVERTSYQ